VVDGSRAAASMICIGSRLVTFGIKGNSDVSNCNNDKNWTSQTRAYDTDTSIQCRCDRESDADLKTSGNTRDGGAASVTVECY